MTLKEYITTQLNSIERNRAIDQARIDGFYQGVATVLNAIPKELLEEPKEKDKKVK